MDAAMREWLDDVVALVDDETGPREVLPDFSEVVARAHAIDPEVIGEDQLDEARALAPVIPLGASVPEDIGPDAGLAAFLDDVRADGEAAAERRAMAAIPSVPAARLPARASSRRWTSIAAAAAAVLVLGVGIAGAVSALRAGSEDTAVQAEYEAQPPAPSVAPAPTTGASAPEVHEAVETDTAPEAVDVDTAAPDEESPDTQAAPRPRVRRDKTSPDDRLRALDEEAQRLWRAGDIPGAQKLFREIIRIGRRGHYVQLSYGDLFNIARSGSAEDRQDLWREYLRKFPKGRHADDARGGLCRTAAADEQATCWERYLADMPQGSYRRQAMRALEQR